MKATTKIKIIKFLISELKNYPNFCLYLIERIANGARKIKIKNSVYSVIAKEKLGEFFELNGNYLILKKINETKSGIHKIIINLSKEYDKLYEMYYNQKPAYPIEYLIKLQKNIFYNVKKKVISFKQLDINQAEAVKKFFLNEKNHSFDNFCKKIVYYLQDYGKT
ncbi:MAG: hypothetical protein ACO2O4_01135 [Minisyncoccia bacterium]|jgi:hypothetical protein